MFALLCHTDCSSQTRTNLQLCLGFRKISGLAFIFQNEVIGKLWSDPSLIDPHLLPACLASI